ncbi:MAG TPA: hypothetical protein VFY32_16210 [Solirubrobacteraceae bacterium]|nr:hypothetical protein [Solirubrobacteraceae bacterium]
MLTSAVVSGALAAGVALVVAGCGERPGEPSTVDGVYRATIGAEDLAAINSPEERAPSGGAWTLVLDRGRFAITQDAGGQGCAWAYGALGLGARNVMRWTVIDAGAVPAGVASNQPGDRYRFGWVRYRDVLTLSTARGSLGGYFAAKPWRRIARRPAANGLSTRCPPPAVALQPTGAEHATPAPDAVIHLTADLVRRTSTTWKGSGREEALGPGRLRIDGDVSFFSEQTRRRLTFAARFAGGELRGCAINTITRRPHARYLWQGQGQITATSPALHAYLGLPVSIGATTMTAAVTHMHGVLADASEERTSAPGDLC